MTGNKNSQQSEVSIDQKQVTGGDMLYAVGSLEEGSHVVSVESSGTRYVLNEGVLESFTDDGFEIRDSQSAGMKFSKRDAKELAQKKIRQHGESQNQ